MTKEPILLSKWYEYAKWLLERVENIPKSQRFMLGQRLADGAMDVMELLVEAAYTREKKDLLLRANRKVEVLRWVVRMACARGFLTEAQYRFSSEALTECGRMLGGWIKQAA